MSKIMLVNVTHVEETRVAVLDEGVLETYDIETINRTSTKGNIYNAVVESVHPSLEAAFLKIAPDLKGFLPLDEVNFKLLPARDDSRKLGRIGQHLHPGQKLMAQVVREPFAGKPPTVSTYFSLPGRFLVLMPGVDSSGVSRKIEDAEQRDRLKKITSELRLPEGFGLIVRTAGVGQTKAELQRDLRYLLRLWQSIQRDSKATPFPGLVYREADLVIRTIRDHFTPDISEVWIDSQETYDRALEFVRDVMPTKAKTLRLHTGTRPLFNKFNLEEQIESIYKRRVSLPSGGEIVIDGTEALTAIDVNSARSRRQGDAEENATQTNLEAAKEVARQFRLRDLGGLIVIDFIDMNLIRNTKKIEKTMRDSLRSDKAKYDVTRISKMGLMEISRQRLKAAKMGATYTSCPACEGYGLVKNVEAAALAALRKLQTRGARGDIGRIRVGLPPDVATWILNHKKDDLVQMEKRHHLRIDIQPTEKLLRHASEVECLPRETPEEPAARVVGDRTPPVPPTEQEMERVQAEQTKPSKPSEAEPAPADAPPTRRRRRRRRKGGRSGDESRGSEDVAQSDEAGPDRAGSVPAVGDGEPAPEDREESGEADKTAASLGSNEERGDSGPTDRRRKRRRRRRGRAGSQEAPADAAPAERPEANVIPQSVSSDELMPAAGRKKGQDGGRRPRRKRRSGPGGQ